MFKPVVIDWAGNARSTSFRVFPNPLAGNTLNVAFNEAQPGQLAILDGNGQVVFEEEIIGDKADFQVDLDDNIAAGVYVVTFVSGHDKKSIKLLKK